MRQLLHFRTALSILILLILSGWNPLMGQGTETLDNLDATSSTYSDGTFLGQDGSTWTYIQCRSNFEITDKGIMLGRNRDPQANFYSGTIAGGIGSLSFDYMQSYSTDVELNVLVNDVVVGTVTSSNEQDIVKNSGDLPVNVQDDFVLKFINVNNTDGQVVVDNISWTAYDPNAGTLSNLTIPGTAFSTGEEVTITWSATDVATIKFQVRDEPGTEWFDLEGLESVDATLGTVTFNIPTYATEGASVLRIVDTSNPSVFAESAIFTLTDVHFAGLYPGMGLFPANEATEVPIDLFGVITVEDEDPFVSINQLLIHFFEEVQAGSGNIRLYKTEGNELITTFSITGSGIEFWGPAVAITISPNLEPNTQYYVTIEEGAITDQASTPNSFDGNITWGFTTGASDSFETIPEIRGTGDVPALLNKTLITKGMVTHIHPDGTRFWIQDNNSGFNGLLIDKQTSKDYIYPGDMVTLAGTVDHHEGITRLTNIIDIEINYAGPMPEATLIELPLEEKWESMLVKIEDIHYTDSPINQGEFEVSDNNNTGLIDDWLYQYTPLASEQFTSITGLLNFSDNAFKIAPRNAGDIESSTVGIHQPDIQGLYLAPNPVYNLLFITSPEAITSIQIINPCGIRVKEVRINGNRQTTLRVDDLPSGLYLIQIKTISERILTGKIIKK